LRGERVPLHEAIADVVTITNHTKQRVRFSIAPARPSALYKLQFEPEVGVLKKVRWRTG
jgi:hypothetical protein